MAAAVRRCMDSRGATLKGLSETAGIPLTTLHRRLSTPDGNPFRWTELVSVAEALGTSASRLAADADERETSRAS